MRRKTRKALVHLTIFGSLLCLILWLNRPQSNNKEFAWSKIQYKTISSTLPEARGICPGLASATKPALIVSRVATDGDAKWLEALSKKYHLCIYKVGEPIDKKSVNLQVPTNKGHEAMAYLTFLIDNYESIPAAGAVFVHGSRWAWHNDHPEYDNAVLLRDLNVAEGLRNWGFHNLRCDWSLSTCSPKYSPQGSLDTSMQSVLAPYDAKAVSDSALPGALASLFGGSESNSKVQLGRNNAVRAQCCAQFVVSRERIWQHTREEYFAIRQWLLDGSGVVEPSLRSKVAPQDDRVSGRILSYVWHILFIEQDGSGINLEQLNTRACPRADECYCRLYGRCDLTGCTDPGKCVGQYTLPKNLKIPDDWATTHS